MLINLTSIRLVCLWNKLMSHYSCYFYKCSYISIIHTQTYIHYRYKYTYVYIYVCVYIYIAICIYICTYILFKGASTYYYTLLISNEYNKMYQLPKAIKL